MKNQRIVALHGNIGEGADWSLWKESWEGAFLAPTLWDFFKDTKSLSKKAVLETIEASQDRGNVLFGYSLGGRVALELAARKPERYRALVLFSANLGLIADAEKNSREKIDFDWARLLLESSEEFLEKWMGQEVFRNDQILDRREVVEEYWEEIAASFSCFSVAKQPDFRAFLLESKIPILLVVGEKDEKYLKQYQEMAELAGAHVQLLVRENMGHRSYSFSESLKAQIHEFLSERNIL